MIKKYGYARVSTREQNLDRQLTALREYIEDERDIITDKESGKDFDRAGYQYLRERLLRPGDVLIVKSLDRLGPRRLRRSCCITGNRRSGCRSSTCLRP